MNEIPPEELKQFSILSDLDDEELAALTPLLGHVALEQGQVLFREGEASDEIYLVRSGSVEILKAGRAGSDTFVIAGNTAGEVFGELAFLDGSPRSAEVRAAEACSLLVIRKEPLYGLPFSHKVIASIARISSGKLRETASEYVTSLEKQIEAVRTQNEFGHLFTYILTLMAISMIINNLLHTYFTSISPYSLTFFLSYSVLLAVPSLVIVLKLKMPWSAMGLTLENWRKSLAEGLGVCGVLILLFWITTALISHFDLMPLKPFSIKAVFTPIYGPPVYFLHSAGQELVARGFLQTSFEHFLNDKTGVRSIGFTALLFGLFHIHFGMGAVLVTFFSSLLFGAVYRRHKNLIGVCLVHYMGGTGAFVFGLL